MKCHRFFLAFLLFIIYAIEAAPVDQGLTSELQGRFADAVSEIEWLLNQLVSILTEMTDGIEEDKTLLDNNTFRLILVQVIRRIDYILEHFENAGPGVLTPTVHYELTRIDCVRIRLANYISNSRKFDDSRCRMIAANDGSASNGGSMYETTRRPVQVSNPQGNTQDSNDQVLPLLTQVVSLLVKILDRLNSITAVNPNQPANDNGGYVPTTEKPMWAASTINWDQVMNQYSTSSPIKGNDWAGGGIDSGSGTTPNWDDLFGSSKSPTDNDKGTTVDWNNLISQVVNQMGSSLVPGLGDNAPTTPASAGTTNWEDAITGLLNEWNQSKNGNYARRARAEVKKPNEVKFESDLAQSLINEAREKLPELARF